jgi:hypothetical protein
MHAHARDGQRAPSECRRRGFQLERARSLAGAPSQAPPSTVTSPAAQAPGSVYYANCTAARAAGAAPLHRGDPGYRAALDRDSDGNACE